MKMVPVLPLSHAFQFEPNTFTSLPTDTYWLCAVYLIQPLAVWQFTGVKHSSLHVTEIFSIIDAKLFSPVYVCG